MKTSTKTVLWGGVATAILGPVLVAQAMVSLGYGVGEFAAVTVHEGVPALTHGLRDYKGGSGGMFGEPDPNGLKGNVTAPNIPAQ